MTVRRPNDFLFDLVPFSWSRAIGDHFSIAFDHAENADGGEVLDRLASLPQRAVIDTVRYVNPTGLADHAANFAVISVKQGAVVVADWSTETGQEGAIAADTYVTLTNGTEPSRIVEADEELVLSVNESGTTTVPAGRVEVYGRYIDDDVDFIVFRALRAMRVDRVDLKLLAGLAASDTNYYTFQLKNGATVVASWDTRAANQGALTADTFGSMTLSATDANRILAAGDRLTLSCAETGDALLSDIELLVHGRYL